MQHDSAEYRRAVESILAHLSGHFLLIAPTNQFHRAASSFLLEARKATFIALADAIDVDGSGNWRLSTLGENGLAAFRSLTLPPEKANPEQVFFATPTEAKWEDLRLHFQDGHTLRASIGTTARTLTFVEMGMCDTRSKKPTVQWDLLREFARERGTLVRGKHGAKRLNQKRRENLAKDLKAFFRLSGEPIVLTDDKSAWRTTFSVLPD